MAGRGINSQKVSSTCGRHWMSHINLGILLETSKSIHSSKAMTSYKSTATTRIATLDSCQNLCQQNRFNSNKMSCKTDVFLVIKWPNPSQMQSSPDLGRWKNMPLQNQWAVTSHAVYLNAKKPWAKKCHIWQMGIIPILQRIITRQTLGTSCWDAHCKFALRAMRWPCCYRVRTARLLWTFQTWTMSGPRHHFSLRLSYKIYSCMFEINKLHFVTIFCIVPLPSFLLESTVPVHRHTRNSSVLLTK